jgi:ribonucleotide reductase alpha subunit
MKKDILAALDKGDIEGARDILLAQTIEEVGDSNSWDSPNYIQKVKTLQEAIPLDHSRSKLLTYFGLETLRDRYFLRSTDLKLVEGPQQFFARVAAGITLADQFHKETIPIYVIGMETPEIIRKATELYDVISKLWFMPATPVLTNTATDRGNLVSCFLSYMGDSITDIYKTIEECAHLGAGGGGLGVYMGDIRGHGAPIRKTLKSSGTIPFMKVLDSNTLAISQGSTRRASAAIYLDISHPDCEEYINIRKPTGGDENRKCLNIHHGVNITDDFMQAVNKKESFNIICPHTKEVVKTIDARTLWKGILKSRIETGEPFIHYIDTSNRNTLKSHSEKGLEIKQSNLCFSGDTIVAVADGRNGVTIKQLAEESKGRKKFPVYCAREAKIKRRGIRGGGVQEAFWANEVKRAVAFKTGVKKLVQVFLDDNSHFKCTKDHLIALKDGGYIEAGNLKSGDSLQPFNTYTRTHKETPYRHIGSATNGHTKQHRLIWEYHNGSIPKGYHIDHINNDIRDDSITNLQMLSATEHRKKTSKEISGTNNWVYRMDSSSRERWLATKNKMAKGESNPNYNGITNEELIAIGKELYAKHGRISQNMLRQYRKDTGVRIPYSFSEMRFGGSWSNYKSMVIGNHKVVRVLELEEEQEVYDLTVEDNHNFYIITSTQDDKYLNCSGVLVHNCSEIILPTNKDRTAICVLGSINIEQCPLDQLEYVSAIATEALDNVLTLFLKTANPRDYKRAIYSASKERSIGLGLMGWHGYLMREKIPFEGVQSVALAKIISEKIQNAARAKSIELAKTKGECEDNPGNRNSYLTAIAPTANISIIAGNCTPCIEPIAGNAYLQKTLSGSFLVKNVYLENLLKEKGQNTAKVWKSIIKNAGSVQQLDFLSEEEKKLFKTAYELDQRFIVKQAAARQKHICQAQSLNLFFGRIENGEIDGMYLHQVHYEAWESGVKTLYYLRSDSVLSAKINTEECVACQ